MINFADNFAYPTDSRSFVADTQFTNTKRKARDILGENELIDAEITKLRISNLLRC